MADAQSNTPALSPTQEIELRHLELIEREVARHRQNGLRVRVAALAVTAGFIALHGLSNLPRYMFLAPMLVAAAWALDAHAAWNVEALRALARAVRGELGRRPPPLSLDTAPVESQASWRRAILAPLRAIFYHPLTTVASIIAVDAPRLDPEGFPTEWMWYVVVVLAAFVGLALATWSWWYDQYGAATPVQGAYPFQPALPSPSPLRDLNVAQAMPAPAPRAERTKPFGTAVLEDVSDQFKKVGT